MTEKIILPRIFQDVSPEYARRLRKEAVNFGHLLTLKLMNIGRSGLMGQSLLKQCGPFLVKLNWWEDSQSLELLIVPLIIFRKLTYRLHLHPAETPIAPYQTYPYSTHTRSIFLLVHPIKPHHVQAESVTTSPLSTPIINPAADASVTDSPETSFAPLLHLLQWHVLALQAPPSQFSWVSFSHCYLRSSLFHYSSLAAFHRNLFCSHCSSSSHGNPCSSHSYYSSSFEETLLQLLLLRKHGSRYHRPHWKTLLQSSSSIKNSAPVFLPHSKATVTLFLFQKICYIHSLPLSKNLLQSPSSSFEKSTTFTLFLNRKICYS